jgi:hypothetical protein
MRLHGVAGSYEYAFDGGSVGCGQGRFHLHGFKNKEHIAGLYGLAGYDIDLDDEAGEGAAANLPVFAAGAAVVG